jgi:hypothetical protein
MDIVEFTRDGVIYRFEVDTAGSGVGAADAIKEIEKRAPESLDEGMAMVEGIANAARTHLAKINVSEAEIEIGLKLTAKAGFIIVGSKAEASLKVKLKLAFA